MNKLQVMRHAGITARQLDHWCTTGYISPVDKGSPGKGNARVFSRTEMEKARTMKCLIDAGFRVERAALLAQTSCKSIPLGHGVTVSLEPHTH